MQPLRLVGLLLPKTLQLKTLMKQSYLQEEFLRLQKKKTGEETQASSSINGKQLSSGDFSSIAGTWTNSRGEFVTISPDGTVQNGRGYTYHLYSGRLNNGNFSGTIASDGDSAAFWAIPGTGNGDLDHLVIGQSDDAENYPFYRN